MYQQVYIQSILKDGNALVGCNLTSCQGCKATMFCTSKKQSFEVGNPDKLPIKPFDKVEIYLPPGKTIASTLMVFGIPLVLFPIAYVLSPFQNTYASGAFAIGAMALGFLATSIYTRMHSKSLVPLITKILKEEIADERP